MREATKGKKADGGHAVGESVLDPGVLLKIECVGKLLERVRHRNLAPEAMEAAITMGRQIQLATAEAPKELRETVGILCRHMVEAREKNLSPVFVEAALRTVAELVRLVKG